MNSQRGGEGRREKKGEREERRLGLSSEIRTYLHHPALSRVFGLVWFLLMWILISVILLSFNLCHQHEEERVSVKTKRRKTETVRDKCGVHMFVIIIVIKHSSNRIETFRFFRVTH